MSGTDVRKQGAPFGTQSALQPSPKNMTTRELALLGVLLAAAIALRLAESALAVAMPLPGAHLGLGNCVTIVVLYLFGARRGALFLVARVLLTGLLFSGLLAPGFLIGLGGAALSFAGMALAVRKDWFSAVGVGLLGAFLHNCGQVLVAALLLHSANLFSYLPVLVLIGIPTGFCTGFLAQLVLRRLSHVLGD